MILEVSEEEVRRLSSEAGGSEETSRTFSPVAEVQFYQEIRIFIHEVESAVLEIEIFDANRTAIPIAKLSGPPIRLGALAKRRGGMVEDRRIDGLELELDEKAVKNCCIFAQWELLAIGPCNEDIEDSLLDRARSRNSLKKSRAFQTCEDVEPVPALPTPGSSQTNSSYFDANEGSPSAVKPKAKLEKRVSVYFDVDDE